MWTRRKEQLLSRTLIVSTTSPMPTSSEDLFLHPLADLFILAWPLIASWRSANATSACFAWGCPCFLLGWLGCMNTRLLSLPSSGELFVVKCRFAEQLGIWKILLLKVFLTMTDKVTIVFTCFKKEKPQHKLSVSKETCCFQACQHLLSNVLALSL